MTSLTFSWLTWSNPVATWWSFLVAISAVNIALLLALHTRFRQRVGARPAGTLVVEPLLWLCTAYVVGCAFRSILPRADVQRICLFDTWLSSVLVGRSVATVAELCFAVQWAIALREVGRLGDSDTAKNVSKMIVPLIVLAECCSWYAVITTNYLGNVIENSLWMVAFLLIGLALARLVPRYRGVIQWAIAAIVAGIACYCVFMVTIDVPMYFLRWQEQEASGRDCSRLFPACMTSPLAGSLLTISRAGATKSLGCPLYFSVAVWMSLALGGFGLIKHRLPRYRTRPTLIPVRNTAAASSIVPRQ